MSLEFLSTDVALRAPAARSAAAGSDLVLLHLDRGTYYTLNVTGAFVWERIDGEATLGEIRDAVVEFFSIDRATAWDDLKALAGELREEGLIEIRAAGAASAQSSNAGR